MAVLGFTLPPDSGEKLSLGKNLVTNNENDLEDIIHQENHPDH